MPGKTCESQEGWCPEFFGSHAVTLLMHGGSKRLELWHEVRETAEVSARRKTSWANFSSRFADVRRFVPDAETGPVTLRVSVAQMQAAKRIMTMARQVFIDVGPC